jgi:LPXTG-motif cell wall-anchored protein
LPNNENKMYKVQDSYRFTVNGEKASVHDLKKGMVISAQKIVEEPKTEIASNTEVVGHAPPPPEAKPVVAEAPAPAKAEAAPTPTPAPAPAEVAEAKPPEALPKTGSSVPLLGVLGLFFTGSALCIRKRRLG